MEPSLEHCRIEEEPSGIDGLGFLLCLVWVLFLLCCGCPGGVCDG